MFGHLEYLKIKEKNSIEKCSEIFEKYIKNKNYEGKLYRTDILR